MRSGAADHVLETIEQCRIRWARVWRVEGATLQVEVVPLELHGGKLALGAPHLETVTRWVTGRGFVDDVSAGEWVAVHWGWACARLQRASVRTLSVTRGCTLPCATRRCRRRAQHNTGSATSPCADGVTAPPMSPQGDDGVWCRRLASV